MVAVRSEYAGVVAPPVRRAFEALTKRLAKLGERATALEGRAVAVAGTTVATSDASGDLSIAFGVTFTAAPMVATMNGDDAAAQFTIHTLSISTTGIAVRIRRLDTGGPVPTTTVRINWIAVGSVA